MRWHSRASLTLVWTAAPLITMLKQMLQHCCVSGTAAYHVTVRSCSVIPGFANAGLAPEKLVKQLCSNRVNYYFAQINTTTVHMTNLFAEEYRHSQNAVFKVLDRGATASTFIPIVVDSVRDSMKRSAFFASGKTASSSGRSAGKGDPRTIFHSVL